MIIKDIKIYHYRLPLKNKISLKNIAISEREGYLVKISDTNNNFGWGEVAPLMNFSIETIDECLMQLKEIEITLANQAVPNDLVESLSVYAPSVRFGVESALLNLMASSKNLSLAKLSNPHCQELVEINGLLSGSFDEIINKAKALNLNGYNCFKLKVVQKDFAKELELIEQIRDIIGDEKYLRLDANRSFDLKQGMEFLEKIDNYNIEYIEEPFSSVEFLKEYLSYDKIIPVALDETLRELSFEDIKQFPGLKKIAAFVLKPTMTGYTQTMSYVKLAFENEIKPIISSSYESSIGIYVLASMATIIDNSIPVGLDTLDKFKVDTVVPSLEIMNSKLNLETYNNLFDNINFKILEEVAIDSD